MSIRRTPARFVLSAGKVKMHASCALNSSAGRSSFLLGGGDENYQFPENLVQLCCQRIHGQGFALQRVNGNANDASLDALRPPLPGLSVPDVPVAGLPVPGLPLPGLPMPTGIEDLPADPPSADEPSALRRGAQANAFLMTDGIFVEPIYRLFRPDLLLLSRDKEKLPPEMHGICDSLHRQLESLLKQVTEALPQVMAELRDMFPMAHTAQLYETALHLIAQELQPILTTLELWTTGFRQWLDPELEPKLRILRAKIEQKLWLVLTGNLRLDLIQDPEQVQQLVKTIKLVIGDVIVPVLIGPFDSGPAVIPIVDGTVGPQGGHLLFYPWNMLEALSTSDPIYDHEVGHLLMSIIKGFEREFAKMVVDGLDKAFAQGELKFSCDSVLVGKQEVPSLDFLKMVFLNQLGELVADLFGCLIGGAPAFASCFGTYIGAMTSLALGGMDQVDHILRNSSSYTIERMRRGRVVITLEPHPQDNVRCGRWQRDIANGTGFAETAGWLEELLEKESGKPVPLEITWVGEEPQDDEEASDDCPPCPCPTPEGDAAGSDKDEPELPTISMLVADFSLGSKVLADYLLNTPAKCLNGMTIKELVCLTPKMQEEKIDPLKQLLKDGIGKLPADGRHYYFHHVGSAATLAFDELVAAGVDAKEALRRVNEAGQLMMSELLSEWEKMVQELGVYNLNARKVLPGGKRRRPRSTPKATGTAGCGQCSERGQCGQCNQCSHCGQCSTTGGAAA